MSYVPVAEGDQTEPVTGEALGIKGIAWAIFEWARNPYYNVIVIYVFTIYFSQQVVGGGPAGQTVVATTITAAGLIMAILAPVLGVIVDKGGRKKVFIFAVLLTLGLCSFALGFIYPETPGAVPIGMVLLATAYCCYTISELLHNALLPAAGAPSALPMISGLGLAFGNIAGVIMLLGLIVAPMIIPWVAAQPYGVGPLSGPIVAIWLGIFIIPFFLFMPDKVGSSGSWGKSVVQTFTPPNFKLWGPAAGLNYLWSAPINAFLFLVQKFRESPNVMKFLLVRMIYADGLAVLLTLGGVYVAGVLGWSGTEVIVYGIFGSLIGALGGIVGGWLDGLVGPKRALIIELSAILILLITQLSITPEALLFGLIPSGHEVWDGFGTGLFTSLTDLVYFLMIVPVAISIVACISSSRYMLVHISPPDRIGEFFGFYAMAASVTVWIGPLVVSVMTAVFDDQRIGFSAVSLLFIAGLIGMAFFVRADKTPEHLKAEPTY
ncbi:MAG: MFS transporter [Hyphomonadaceae bacterium]|nr:MFS transporter [Hyphomonadaceae bacterium]